MNFAKTLVLTCAALGLSVAAHAQDIVVNGSTTVLPVMQKAAESFMAANPDIKLVISGGGSGNGIKALGEKQCDVAMSSRDIKDKERAAAEKKGVKPVRIAVAVDAIVPVVNPENPVKDLTLEQLSSISAGKVRNWKEVGGNDVEIVPFQRNEEAGSQTAMKKLVMGDIPMMEAPAEYVSGAMGDLVEVVASYNDSAAAIGYTVYYYAHDMKMADGLKIIAVDGVQPNAETIRRHEYPFINDSYVVIAAGLADDSPTKILYNWIMSEEGQKLVAHEGYVSVLDVGDAQ